MSKKQTKQSRKTARRKAKQPKLTDDQLFDRAIRRFRDKSSIHSFVDSLARKKNIDIHNFLTRW